IESMTRLNRHPSHIVRAVDAHALTDVTGYSLLGHGYELAVASKVTLRFRASSLPLLPGALEYASRGIVTGGAARNRKYLADKVSIAPEVPEALQHVLFDPQTSGGLLFAVAPEKAKEVEARFAAAQLPVWRLGEAAEGQGIQVAA
ncbi:MAG TPA: AIR synthase-related protein, partial [Dehalococcoidia bacterium]|nr:AIR synthase-related protein [Dehalococcoidia bacterium]